MQIEAQPTSIPVPILRTFHPSWFGAVMGTAVIGVVAAMNPGAVQSLTPVMDALAVVMLILAYILAIALGIPYIARWLRHTETAATDSQHPIVGAMYGTFPGGLLVLAAATGSVGPLFLPQDAILALIVMLAIPGVLAALAISVAFTYNIFTSDKVSVEHVNGGWFIPPVVFIIVPMVLVPLLPRVHGEIARLLLAGSYAAWGIGFFLFLLVASLLYDRMVLHALPLAPLAPSLWIGLGPLGVGALAFLRLAQGPALAVWGEMAAGVQAVSAMVALAMWGFGLWWMIVAALLLWRYTRRGGIPFGLSWWALVFPLGAYTLSTLSLARLWKLQSLEALGALFSLALILLWLLVAWRTLRGVISGNLWKR